MLGDVKSAKAHGQTVDMVEHSLDEACSRDRLDFMVLAPALTAYISTLLSANLACWTQEEQSFHRHPEGLDPTTSMMCFCLNRLLFPSLHVASSIRSHLTMLLGLAGPRVSAESQYYSIRPTRRSLPIPLCLWHRHCLRTTKLENTCINWVR